MKEKKIYKNRRNPEIQRLQKLHLSFEAHLKQRLKNFHISQKSQLLQQQAMHESEELFRTTFEHAAIGIAHVDLKNGRWMRVNKRFCEIAGWSEKELLKQTFLDTTHPDDHEVDLKLIDDVLKGKVSSISMEKRYVRKDKSNRWVYATASIIRDTSGEPKYGIAIVEDIHEKKQAGDAWKLLAEVSTVLGNSLDYQETISAATKILVPVFADWCVIDLLEENNSTKRVKVEYADPKKKKLAEKLYQYPPNYGSKSLIENTIRSGKSILIPEVDPTQTSTYTYDVKHLNLILRMKQRSFMCVPMFARGKIIGAISFRSTQDFKKYSSADLLFAEQVASRIALAVDNARLYDQAGRAIKIRDDFLSIASHELKTSLTTVKAMAQVLQMDIEKKGDGRSLNFLRKMDSQLNRATNLINELFDVSRMQSGKITITKEWVDIYSVVKEAVENCQRFSTKHKIVFKGKMKQKIYGDLDRIHQVLTNLITNAMKYSHDKTDIIVYLKKEKASIVINIKDFGIGIEKDKREKIFERFFRADNDSKDKTAGMGLGLYISQQLVKQHGGEIKVKSAVGKGSTFSIFFPLKKAEQKIKALPQKLLKRTK